MKTIRKDQRSTLRFSLNRSVAAEGVASLSLNSPSRGTLTFTKSLTNLGSGFFSLVLDFTDTAQLEDDTYSYELTQDGTYLKTGFIRLLEADLTNGQFDYKMDFLMS